MLALGYARPLEATDLWKLDEGRQATLYANRIIDSFQKRYEKAEEYNTKLLNGETRVPIHKVLYWSVRGNRKEREKTWREKDGRKQPSLLWAINDSVKYYFWSAGVFKVIGDTSQVTAPLVVKVLPPLLSQNQN
jgi:hypothetical protein